MYNFNELQYKKREGWTEAEDYLTNLSFNLFHVLSLVWSKRAKKYTKDYVAFLSYEILSDLFNAAEIQGIGKDAIIEELTGISNAATADDLDFGIDDMIYGFTSELILADPRASTTISVKVGLFLHLLTLLEIPWKLITACYQPETCKKS